MSHIVPRQSNFPRDGLFYKLIWVNDVSPPIRQNAYPSIQVILAPLSIKCSNHKNITEITSIDQIDKKLIKSASAIKKQRIVRNVSIAHVGLILVGSIWQDGYCAGMPEYDEKTFEVTYSNTTTKIINVFDRDPLYPANYIVKPNIYPLTIDTDIEGNSNVYCNTKCLAVENEGEPFKLIIPCMEIIRFYYCINSEMSAAMFLGGFEHFPDEVYNKNKSNFHSATPFIQLGKRMPFGIDSGDLTARLLANLLMNANAKRRANQIHETLITTNGNGFRVPWTIPPFDGKTNLKVVGKWIPTSEPKKFRFLVYRIMGCDLPFPQPNVEWASDIDNAKAPHSEEGLLPAFPDQPFIAGDEIDPHDVELDPDIPPSRIRKGIRIDGPESNYLGLLNVEANKKIKDKQKYHNDGTPINLPNFDGYGGAGDGSYDFDAPVKTSIDSLILEDEELIIPGAYDFNLFIQTLAELPTHFFSEKEDKKKRVITFSSQTEKIGENVICCNGINRNLFPSKYDGNKLFWSFLDDFSKVPRQCIVARLECNNNYFYLMEAQASAKEDTMSYFFVWTEQCLPFDNKTLQGILLQCASNGGGWLKNLQKISLKRRRFYHREGDTAKSLSARIYSVIISEIKEFQNEG